MSSTGGISDLFFDPSITTTTAIQGKSTEDMGMEDFFNLLVAQMTNQDMMNPQENTEFISQMAQFTSLKGIQTIQEYQLSSYAMSYAGKTVTIADVDKNGDLVTINGVVESVTFYDGTPKVKVNGKEYDLYKVMEVNNPSTASNALNQYSSYIGKDVILTATGQDGMPYDVTGTVTSVTLKGGVPYVEVDGVTYPASSITDIVTVASTANNDDDDDSGATNDGDDDETNSVLDTDDE